MGESTSIAWANSTWNGAMGCTKISEGCKNCYMFRDMPKWGRDPSKITFTKLEGIENKIKKYGEYVFFNSMSDTFHKDIPDEQILQWFNIMSGYPDKKFLVLTKRNERMQEFVSSFWRVIPENIWFGVSVESAKYIDRIYSLGTISIGLNLPNKTFISFEPLLEDIPQNLLDTRVLGDWVDWVIVGGESGINARPMKPEWASKIKLHCASENIPFFFKQMGAKIDRDGAGGDLLFGKQYKERPL